MNGKKISAHIAGGALATIVVWLINAFTTVQVPAEVAVAFGTVFAIMVSLLVPDNLEDDEGSKQGGFAMLGQILVALVLSLGVVAFIGCSSVQVDSRNKAQALSYYTIGQGYDAIGAARKRGEITLIYAKVLERELDLSLQLLDITRDPTNKGIQDAMRATLAELSQATFKGKPVLSAMQVASAQRALDIAEKVTGGGSLPSTDDTSGWLLLGADLLRSVNDVTQPLPAK